MMKASAGRSNPQIAQVVNALLTEDSNFDRHENRSAHREHLVRPIKVEIREPEQIINAFSRNISTSGIGIISDTDVAIGTVAVLEIGRLKCPSQKILAECRWSRSYGDNWFISGWQFISLRR